MSDTTAPAAVGSSSMDRAWLLPSSPFGITVREKGAASRLISFAPVISSVVPLRLAAV